MYFKDKKAINVFLRAFLLLFIASSTNMHAQTLDEAREMIRVGNYPAAREAFATLIENNKNRADVNKWYGEALYETGDYAEAEKYLKIAAARKIPGAYLYLAKVYQKTYRFTDAVKNLERYRTLIKKDPEETEKTDILIEQCELGEKGLRRVEMVQVIDSMIVDKDKFFEYYKLGQDAGRLIDYRMLSDADPELFTTVFESQRGDKRMMGHRSDENGYDLFQSNKLYGDNWSDPVSLPDNINTAANENFPFVMTDGLTIYFASDREPSMGGYDLYVSKYNPSNESYFNPERLPMPFNSPFNDYLMAIDETNNVGWFASDRFQAADKVIIYLFIYTENKNYYRDLTPEESIARAEIRSIRDTWTEDASYDQLLYNVYNAEQYLSKKKAEFYFVINDKIIYTNYDEFESGEARSLFTQAMKAQAQLDDAETELGTLRLQWTKGNKQVRERVSSKILQLESKSNELAALIPELKLKARNTEINHIRNKR